MATRGLGQYSEQDVDKGQLAIPGLNHYGFLIGGLFADGSCFGAAVEAGRVFAFTNQTATTSAAGLSPTTPGLTLYNPPGSGVTGRLWMASATQLVAPAVVATVWLAAGTDTIAANTTGTIATAHRCLRMGGITPASQGNRVVALLQATLGSTPVAIDVLGANLTGAITTVTSVPAMSKCYHGALLIQPGTHLSIQTSSASGASGLVCSFVWEEHDVIA